MNSRRDAVVALLPAAGSGSRMGSDTAKQYLELNGQTVLECTLDRIRGVAAVEHIVIVVAATEQGGDRHYPADVSVVCGGESRAQSVLNGLRYIQTNLKHAGMVLVHDAARPCVRVHDIKKLVNQVGSSSAGGILAIPVHDTLKRSDEQQRISTTVNRERMWRAVTPQLFNVDVLEHALGDALARGVAITDEASAMEHAGYQPQLIESAQDNIKITLAQDLKLAGTILEAQEQS